MVNVEKVMELLEQFATNDIGQRAAAREEIRSIGRAALPTLYKMKFRVEGEAYTEVIKTIVAIGDDLFAVEGKEGLDSEILNTIESDSKKTRQYAAEEVHNLSVGALTRWGFEVPPVMVQKVRICHICGRKSTDLRVEVCSLHSCDIEVCKNDAHVISTRFGEFDGSGGAWFCTQAHHDHANKNHVDWN